MKNKFLSRRWNLAVFFSLASTAALFTGFMSDVLYVSVVTTIMGIYGLHDHFNKKNINNNPTDDNI